MIATASNYDLRPEETSEKQSLVEAPTQFAQAAWGLRGLELFRRRYNCQALKNNRAKRDKAEKFNPAD
jgi:hypothetical protein